MYSRTAVPQYPHEANGVVGNSNNPDVDRPMPHAKKMVVITLLYLAKRFLSALAVQFNFLASI